jgi:rhamnosyltransferase
MSAPLVSVMLPTWNGAATLPAVLDALAGQRADFAFEIVAVDSGSTDGTLALLRERIDRVLQVPHERFNHGLTRNLGLQHCRGELAVLLVQDAVPASGDWLVALTAPLLADPRLAGSYARQIVRPDASAITRYHLGNWIATSPAPRITFVDDPDRFLALPPKERFLSCVFDNVCSCVRRSVWERHPFRETPIAEDLEWAREVLLAGFGLAYAPAAAVVHSHERPASYELKRTYLVHRRLQALFGLRTIPTLVHLAGAIAATLWTHWRCVTGNDRARRPSLGELRRAAALGIALPLGQYAGGLAEARGWRGGPLRGV